MQWACTACGYHNDRSPICDACGVARRHLEDPPLDIPRRPRWAEIGAAYLAGTYALLALGGLTVLAIEPLRSSVGLGSEWIALEIVLAAAATYAAAIDALWTRRFNQASLSVPRTVRTGLPFDAVVTLVPYERLERVWVTIELVDRFFETVHRGGRRSVRTRSRVVERIRLQAGESVAGRREATFIATFHAPVPSIAHGSVHAEIQASIAAFFGPLVPGLAHHARNLRQHGGYHVRARIRTGLWRRAYEQQVISVMVSVGPRDAQSASSTTSSVATASSTSPSGVQP